MEFIKEQIKKNTRILQILINFEKSNDFSFRVN